jgi:hypothetical protein
MKGIRSFLGFLTAASLVACLGLGILAAQKVPGLGNIKKKFETFSLSRFLEGEPPLSTSLDDAVTEVPFLDDFNPPDPAPMAVLPRAENGNFLLVRPGVYEFTAASYCMRAGTYAPAKGDGYLYAPLKGKRAGIVQHILEKSVFRRDVRQYDIQCLIWAIVARSNFRNMMRPVQIAATKLLTPAEIATLSGASLDSVSDAVLEKAMDEAGLSPTVRDALRAESRIRGLMTQADTSYADLEKVAVLTGTPLPGEGSREVAAGRWSLHPNGYFIRYFPYGYTTTDIQVCVPRPFRVDRDSAGRITTISDAGGSRIEFEYDATVDSRAVSANSSLKVHAIKLVHFSGVHPWQLDRKIEGRWTGAGWALAGFSTGEEVPGEASAAFPDSKARLGRAKNLQKSLAGLSKAPSIPAGLLPPDRAALCLEIGSLCEGLREIISAHDSVEKGPGSYAYAFLKMAWQSALIGKVASAGLSAGRAGSWSWIEDDSGFPGTGMIFTRPGHGPWLDPDFGIANRSDSGAGGQGGSEASFGGAMPGNTSKQRLGESARPADTSCQASVNYVQGDVKVNGEPASVRTLSGAEVDGAVFETGRKARVEIVLPDGSVVRLGGKSKFSIPPGTCEQAQADQAVRAKMQVLLDAGFLYATPVEGEPFQITTGNAVDGIRGDLQHLIHGPGDRIFLASMGGLPQEAITEAEIEGIYNELKPSEAELAAYKNAYFVACERDVYYYVRVDRGMVDVGDSKGGTVTVRAGDHLLMRLAPAPAPSARKDIFVRNSRGN